MASNNRLCIQPVYGITGRKLSTGVLDTAETLVENLDSLSDVLDKLAEKYDIESAKGKHVQSEPTSNSEEVSVGDVKKCQEAADLNLFRKLKTGLDSARTLIGSLRREKGRLMKRELSVECRMGEIEDYKSHMKHDLTSLNDLVDMLTVRVCDAETELCAEQETSESLEMEKTEVEERLKRVEKLYTDTIMAHEKTLEENKRLLKERTNTSLKLENKELNYKVEVLVVENQKLKEMIRRNSVAGLGEESDGDLGTALPDILEDSNNNFNRTVSVSSESDASLGGNSNNFNRTVSVSSDSDASLCGKNSYYDRSTSTSEESDSSYL